jgi:hypothetical protein
MFPLFKRHCLVFWVLLLHLELVLVKTGASALKYWTLLLILTFLFPKQWVTWLPGFVGFKIVA